MRRLILVSLFVASSACAEGYYYPVPANPPGFVYALPPAYVVPPQQNYLPPPVYIQQPQITPGQPPKFEPFDTGRVVPRGGNKD